MLETGYADGATNMAIDEAILLAVMEGKAPPTLRFYGWHPPCLSVGYGQPVREEVDVEECRAAGVDIVRRPTGGKAILHAEELTYSVILPADHPLAQGTVLDSYRRLSYGLIKGLEILGVEAWQAGPLEDSGYTSAACFEVPTDYEVKWRNRKIVGSAQLRRRGGLLQHGSIPLRGDVAAIVDFLLLSPTQKQGLRERLRNRAATLEEALGKSITWAETLSAMAQGFKEAFGLRLISGELTPYEREQAERLKRKYLSAEWTFKH